MSLVFFGSSVVPSLHINQLKVHNSASRKHSLANQSFSLVHYKLLQGATESICTTFRDKSPSILKFTAISAAPDGPTIRDVSLNWDDPEEEDTKDPESPWEGAIIYKRNPSILHVEYCTTLERLGLGEVSTDVSKSRASLMGIRVTKAVKDFPNGTPVQISIDVTRRKGRLRLDGIIKTVLTLECNNCGEPAAECVYSNFSLLLCEEPFEEPEVIDFGVIYGEDKSKSRPAVSDEDEDDDDDASIDWDDRFYFPPEAKEIDISKNIRDLLHVEITIEALCDPRCKGLCLECGTNLNESSCKCNKEKPKVKVNAAFKNLRTQMMQQKS